MPWHPDPSVRLAGVSRLASARLSKEVLANPTSVIPKGPAYQFHESKPSSSPVAEAEAVLRLLHIQDLRVLQTQINEAIVAVQKVLSLKVFDATVSSGDGQSKDRHSVGQGWPIKLSIGGF